MLAEDNDGDGVMTLESIEDGTITPISEWPIANTETCNSTQIKIKDNVHGYNSNSGSLKPLKRRSFLCYNEYQESDKKLKNSSCSTTVTKTPPNDSIIRLGESVEIKDIQRSPYNNHKEHTVTAKIARWWRQKRIHGVEHSIPEKCGPNSMVYHISRLPECRSFLQRERKRLLTTMELSTKKADFCAALASLEDYLENFSSALSYIEQAVKLETSCKDYQWLKEKISRQCQALRRQTNANKQTEDGDLKFPTMIEVPRISGKTLTVEDFQKNFLRKCKPVIITDVVTGMTLTPFDFSLVLKHAGQTTVTTKSATCDSLTWARLENKRDTTVAELVQGVETGTANDVVFDWSLPLHCPSLARLITLPPYFKNNFLVQTSPGSLYRESWPSLFIAPKGATTQLHIDTFHSHFWMALFQGEKRWTFFDQQDTPFLYPRWFQSMDPVFEVDLAEPDLKRFPLLALTRPQQCALQKDELLFVPAGSPHFVENLTPTLAISSNYVDHSNISKVCEELRINALQDQRASDLLSQLQDPAFLRRVENPDNEETS